MGGSVGVESEFGKGSAFFFSVKFEECDEVAKSSNVSSGTKSLKIENAHVLLVEDKLINQKVSSIILTKLGFTFEIAENGQ